MVPLKNLVDLFFQVTEKYEQPVIKFIVDQEEADDIEEKESETGDEKSSAKILEYFIDHQDNDNYPFCLIQKQMAFPENSTPIDYVRELIIPPPNKI